MKISRHWQPVTSQRKFPWIEIPFNYAYKSELGLSVITAQLCLPSNTGLPSLGPAHCLLTVPLFPPDSQGGLFRFFCLHRHAVCQCFTGQQEDLQVVRVPWKPCNHDHFELSKIFKEHMSVYIIGTSKS